MRIILSARCFETTFNSFFVSFVISISNVKINHFMPKCLRGPPYYWYLLCQTFQRISLFHICHHYLYWKLGFSVGYFHIMCYLSNSVPHPMRSSFRILIWVEILPLFLLFENKRKPPPPSIIESNYTLAVLWGYLDFLKQLVESRLTFFLRATFRKLCFYSH